MKKGYGILFLIISAIAAACAVIFNFNSELFYSADIFADAYIGGLMAEKGTLFPDGWVFGNQYYIITPSVLSALVIKLTGADIVTAMSVSSSIFVFLILLSLVYFLRGAKIGFTGIAAGLLCLSGGVIFDFYDKVCMLGLQMVFTKAAYYSAYFVVILLTLGVYLRIRSGGKRGPAFYTMASLTVAMNFALGMQSLRGILVLSIPLCCLALVHYIWKKGSPASAIYAGIVMIASAAGFLFMKALHIPYSTLVGPMEIYIIQLKEIVRSFFTFSGIYFIKMAWKEGWWHLVPFFCSLIILFFVAKAIYKMFKDKESEGLAAVVILCVISLGGVYATCLLSIVSAAPRYFFIWYILTTACIVYVIDKTSDRKKIRIYSGLLAVVGIAAVLWNYLPYYKRDRESRQAVAETTGRLLDNGTTAICAYYMTHPIFAGYAHGKIYSVVFYYNQDGGDKPLQLLPFFNDPEALERTDYENALICMDPRAWAYAPEDLKPVMEERMEKVDSCFADGVQYDFYKPLTPVL